MTFPLYAKHPDGSVYYLFYSETHFEEHKRLGADKSPRPNIWIRSEVESSDYSTHLYIHDLLEGVKSGSLSVVAASDYIAIKQGHGID